MLESTFRHLPGVGAKTEGRLWSAGVHSWQALTEGSDLPLSARKVERLKGHVGESVRQLSEGNPHYFCDRLPAGEHWRLFPEFRDTVAYVDIETTGLGAPGDYITTVALYDGKTIRHYVRDRNLEDFADDVAQYRIIVTYNGKCVDVPFIRNALGLPMPHAHIGGSRLSRWAQGLRAAARPRPRRPRRRRRLLRRPALARLPAKGQHEGARHAARV